MDTPLLTPKDVAERWRCSLATVMRVIRQGKLRATHLGPKLVRIHPEELEAYERSCIAPAAQAPTDSPGPSGDHPAKPARDARLVALQRRMARR